MTETIAIKKVNMYMERHDLNIRQVSKKFEMKESTVSRWIKGIDGNKRFPNPKNQEKINAIIEKTDPDLVPFNEWIIEA